MDDFIKIIKSLEHSCVLINGVTETVKLEIKKKDKVDFLAPLTASLVQPVISSVAKGIDGRRVIRAGTGYNKTV